MEQRAAAAVVPHAAPGTLAGLALSRSAVDRVAERRSDAAWLQAAWADPATRVVRVQDGRTTVVGDPPALALLSPADVPDDAERYLLGVDDGGTAFFAARAPLPPGWTPEGPGGARETDLRRVGALLGDRDAGLLVNAVALERWHATHTHCPRCGTPTVPGHGGHTRRCPADASEHYPRTDAAVIMAVVDPADRLLLGHQRTWPAGRFSTLAGFVEPGEPLEHAVAREVQEETGVRVREARYLGSQPWPFPASLMLGFLATAETTDVQVDGVEIGEARWFTRDELGAAVADGTVVLPPRVSIARRLIEHWYGAELPEAAGAWG